MPPQAPSGHHDRRALGVNADCAEFCPTPGLTDVLAIGTYQLVQERNTRVGTLFLYTVHAAPQPPDPPSHGPGAVHLADRAAVEGCGIFDIKWRHASADAAPSSALIAQAGSDGAVRVFEVTRSDAASTLGCREAAQMEDAVCGGMCLTVDWSGRPVPGQGGGSRADRIAVSGSNGHVAVLRLAEGAVEDEEVAWNAHGGMEAWCTAFDACSDHVLYTGADDCKLKAWDLRAGTGMAAWVSVGSHGAGVCTVQPSVHREHVIFTGSYDQHLRVWDVRAPGQPVLAAALDTGGGVWRLKEHPESGDVALTASMHGGFCCVRGLSGTAPAVACVYEQGATCPDAMPDQPALAYGCDWYRGGVGGVGTDEDGWLVATASFYDQEMRIWSAPWK